MQATERDHPRRILALHRDDAHDSSSTSRPSKRRVGSSLWLLLLGLLFCTQLALPVFGTIDMTLVFPNGNSTLALSTFGDTASFTQTFTATLTSISINPYVKIATLTNSALSSFCKLTNTPTVPAGYGGTLTLTFTIDPSTVVAGTYTQGATITVGDNNNPSDTVAKSVYLTVTIVAALNFATNQTSALTGVVNKGAPYSMTEGTQFQLLFSLRSQPTYPVFINITANAEHADLPNQLGPLGQGLSGGGPLLNFTTVMLNFTSSNWATKQTVALYAIHDYRMQGSRWTTVAFDFSSNDTFYDALTISPLNITIIEADWASVILTSGNSTSEAIEFDASPGTTADQYFYVSLGSLPLYPVTFSFPSQTRYSLSPNTLTLSTNNFNTPQTITIHIYDSSVISGALLLVQNFSNSVSADPDFNNLPLLPLRINYLAVNNKLASISPPFAKWTQSSDSPTYLTVSYDSPRTFIPTGTEKALPTVQCVFGSTLDCGTSLNFFGSSRSSACQLPYAQTLVAGHVISPTQVSCVIPTCPSVLSTSTNVGMASTTSVECVNSYAVVVLVNGQVSSNALAFVWLMPVGDVSTAQVPQVNSITPTVVDVNEYVWLTVHGANFNMPKLYTNPTLASGSTNDDMPTDLTTCMVGGIIAPAVDTTGTELNSLGVTVTVIKCLSRPRPDLAGSSNNVPVIVEVSLNGQEYTAQGKMAYLYDYAKKKEQNAWTYFYVVVALVGMIFAVMILQHFLCANFFKTHAETEEATKIRVIKGPQMLIDLLEPQVYAGVQLVREIEREEAQLVKQAATENEDLVKLRIAEIQREATAKKEAKRREKLDKKQAKEAQREADRARNEVLAAAGLHAEVSDVSEAESERSDKEERHRRRKEAKREKKAEKAEKREREREREDRGEEFSERPTTPPTASPVASPSGPADADADEPEAHGIELANLNEAQLARLHVGGHYGDDEDADAMLLSPSHYVVATPQAADLASPSAAVVAAMSSAMSPSVAVSGSAFEPSRGYGSDAGSEQEPSSAHGSSKKKKKHSKKHKKDRKELSEDDAPHQQDVDEQQSFRAEVSLSRGAQMPPILMPELDEHGGAATSSRKKKSSKHHKDEKKKSSKKHKSDKAEAVHPSIAMHAAAAAHLTSHSQEDAHAPQSEVSDDDEPHTGRSDKKKSHKSSKKSKKSKSSKKKKDKSED